MRFRVMLMFGAHHGWKTHLRRGFGRTLPAYLFLCLAAPANTQSLPLDTNSSSWSDTAPPETQSDGLEDLGRTADTGIGGVGERTSILANPMGRINSRISNRIENRIRSRLDRDYNPMDDTVSPFEQATDELQDSPR